MEFNVRKKTAMEKVDLSRKGSVDDLIRDLITFINHREEYFTTSSCSGRIVLLSDGMSLEEPIVRPVKKNCKWFLTSHQPVTPSAVISTLHNVTEGSKIKFEPFIVHVQCSTVENAQLLLKAAITSGFRNSGITMNKHCKNVMVAVRATLCLEVPLTDNSGSRLTSDEYVHYVVTIANTKMAENEKRIKKFENHLRNLLDTHPASEKVKRLHNKKQELSSRQTENKNHTCEDPDAVSDLCSLFIT